MSKPQKLSDQIRRLVADADVTAYRISVDTGIDRGNLSRFLQGKAFLSAEAIDALAEYLDLEIKPRKRSK
jgi:transcriptional regulator with XRE-family HTH domain